MAFEWWNRLTDEEKQEISNRAKEAQDRTGRQVCYWCRASLVHRGYDFTSSARGPREICRGQCRNRRFFDNPEHCVSQAHQRECDVNA